MRFTNILKKIEEMAPVVTSLCYILLLVTALSGLYEAVITKEVGNNTIFIFLVFLAVALLKKQ